MGGPGSGPRLKPCGTIAAYKRHRNHGEQPCRACMDAHNAYQLVRKYGINSSTDSKNWTLYGFL